MPIRIKAFNAKIHNLLRDSECSIGFGFQLYLHQFEGIHDNIIENFFLNGRKLLTNKEEKIRRNQINFIIHLPN